MEEDLVYSISENNSQDLLNNVTLSRIFNINSDEENIQPIQRQIKTPVSRKRKLANITSSARKRPLFDDMEEKLEKLALIDPDRKSCIYDYMDRYSTDAIVRYYLELILDVKLIPILPNPEVMKKWLEHKFNFIIPNELATEIVSKFMDYFQSKHFQNNVDGATNNNKKLFNPKNNFNIPHFKILPEKTLEKLTELKEEYVTSVQKESSKGSTFVIQLIILKIVKKISIFIEDLTNSEDFSTQKDSSTTFTEDKRKAMLEYILATTYFRAMIEFPKAKKVNVIDWTKYPSKTTHAIPQWRKQEEINLPIDIPHRLAENLCNKIETNKVSISGKSTRDDYEALVNGEKQNYLSQQFPHQNNNQRYYNNSFQNFRGRFNGTRGGSRGQIRGFNNRGFSGGRGYSNQNRYQSRGQNETRHGHYVRSKNSIKHDGRHVKTSSNSSSLPQGSRETDPTTTSTPTHTHNISNVDILQTFT